MPSLGDILRKYGTSLAETRRLAPELGGVLKQPRQPGMPAIKAPTVTTFLTSDEAKNLGVNIEPDWMLKLTPSTTDKRGFTPSLITPQKWEMLETGAFISPEGYPFTRQEMEAQWTKAEAQQREQEQTQAVFGRVFPDEKNIDKLLVWAGQSEENLNQFYQKIQQSGRTPDTEYIIKRIVQSANPEAPEEDISAQVGKFFQPVMDRETLAKAGLWQAFGAGIGDLLLSGAGVAKLAGLPQIATRLRADSAEFQALYPGDKPGIWDDLIRTAPSTLALIPTAIIAAYGGTAVAGAVGLGALGSFLLSSLGAGVAMRATESAFEAGGTYEQATQMGLNPEQATNAAAETFKKNLALTGLDWAQVATAFAPAPAKLIGSLAFKGLVKTAIVAGKLAITGLSEGGEEVYQQIVQNKALGLPVEWNEEMKRIFLVGSIYGGAMGLAGIVFTEIQERTKNALPGDLKESFEVKQKAFMETGLTKEQARLKALDEIVKTPEGKQIVSDVIEQVKKNEALREIDTSVKSDAL